MTLLSEYQALPGEPEPFRKAPKRLGDILDYQERQLVRREAVIRLLARVLREHLDPNITGHCGDRDCDECEGQAELRALLTAVERDFKEGV